MNNIKSSFLLFTLFLSGCGHNISFKREFDCVQKRTRELIDFDVTLQSPSCASSTLSYDGDGMTRTAVISTALLNNPSLQADFESLGIAKADLVQAGFYTNPEFTTIFLPPLRGETAGNETSAYFALSDLWQVPLRRQVQKDVLEAVSMRILESILETKAEARRAFDKTLFLKEQYAVLSDILQQTKELRDQIYYRQEFGFSSDLDKYFADVTLENIHIQLLGFDYQLKQSYLHLQRVMGNVPTEQPLVLTGEFKNYVKQLKVQLPSVETLQDWALMHRPELLRARIKIKQYEDTVAYEKSRVIRQVSAGFTFKKEFDDNKGIGPSFRLEIPFFDSNQAQIARAEFALKQAQKELQALTLSIIEQIRSAYVHFTNLLEQIAVYDEKVLPSSISALSYTKKFEQVMQITMVVLLQTKTALFNSLLQANEKTYEAYNAFTDLERAVGKSLDRPTYKAHAQATQQVESKNKIDFAADSRFKALQKSLCSKSS